MASNDSSDDECGALAVLPAKRQKRTNFNKCVLCQKDSKETLWKAQKSSIQKLICALQSRRDESYDRLLPELLMLESMDIYWHPNCYKPYTSKQNLSSLAKRGPSPCSSESSRSNNTDISHSERQSRSQTRVTDWSTCIFCKNKTHKKVKELINVCTFEACKSIEHAAYTQGDETMLHVLRSVNNDLVASEAKYHKACYSVYVSKSNLKYRSFKEGIGEDKYSDAFTIFVHDIQPELIAGKAYDMDFLLNKYISLLEHQSVEREKARSYTNQHLKLRMIKFFGDDVVFHKPHAKNKPELIYSSSISLQDVLNAAFQQSKYQFVQTKPTDVQTTIPNQTECTNLLYRTAMLIKSDIVQCKGINIKPIDMPSLNLASAKTLIPEKLYWFLRWLISCDDFGDESEFASECLNKADERKVIMLAQDILHCSSHSRIKTPKHTSLAMAVQHLTGSKELITLLNRMGHCSSYDEVEVIDTSLAREVLAKSEAHGVIIPSNICSGAFVQIAGDNNYINEHTLDGKHTTHATTLVLYQKGQFGNVAHGTSMADHSSRMRSLDSCVSKQIIRDFNVRGKRPQITDFIGKVSSEWFESIGPMHFSAYQMDFAWALMRMRPSKLFDVQISPVELMDPDQQKVPGWSGFHASVATAVPCNTAIGYCPMINGSPTEYSTVYTVMKTAQAMMKSLGQTDSVITFDLAIYVKAKEIQWRQPEEFSDIVIRMGGFHIALNFLALLGKKYDNSGLESILIESEVYGSSTTSALLQGKSYNRGIRAHKLTMEMMFRLQWHAFVKWLNSKHEYETENLIKQKLDDCRTAMFENNENIQDLLRSLQNVLDPLTSKFDQFRNESRKKSELFSFWDDYLTMVSIFLQFVKAERMSNWLLHLSTTAALAPHFYSMDRTHYARWLPVYLADMHQLSEKHPSVQIEFVNGNHAVSRSNQTFAQVWTDMALEQSINRDSKTKGGIVGISQWPGALERWFLTSHERSAITRALKDMCGITVRAIAGRHKEVKPARLKRDEGDVQRMLSVFESGLIINPFVINDDDDITTAMPLINIATGAVAPSDVASQLLNAYKMGKEQMDIFIDQRLNTNEVSFWDTLPHLKVKTLSTMVQKKQVKMSDEKLTTISADRDLFGRLIIASRGRDIDLRHILTFELSSVPFSLYHADGTMRKTNKSALLTELENVGNVRTQLPTPDALTKTVYIFDGMALIQMVKSGGVRTFGELALKLYDIVTTPLCQPGCNRVDVVFDQYNEISIKAGERMKRGSSSALEVKILGPKTPIPRQWTSYIQNPRNKKNLCSFVSNSWCQLGMTKLSFDKQLIIGGGFQDGEKTMVISKDICDRIDALVSDHEEADTRMLLHAKHASSECSLIVVQSPDTDVAMLCVTHFKALKCKELWFRTGVKDKARFLSIHSIVDQLGTTLCTALPAYHALTGCDSTSSMYGIGKKKSLIIVRNNLEHQDTLARFGQNLCIGKTLHDKCERFICNLYTTSLKAGTTSDSARYWLFCQKKQTNEALPPTSDSLALHLKRANYQALVWRKALEPKQAMPSPVNHGWELKDGTLQSTMMTRDPAPRGLLELVACRCATTACRRNNCTCRMNGLACTEACICMADDCDNPNNSMVCDNDESDGNYDTD